MTMDLYGHMIDRNLWDAAQRLRGTTGHGRTKDRTMKVAPCRKSSLTRHNALEPPRGIEPRTYALRVASVSSIKCFPNAAAAMDVWRRP
jgi:hypothetical protein